jgi:GLPGLI family protein
MKKITLLLLLFPIAGFAQLYYPRPYDKKNTIDKCEYAITYKYVFVLDTIQKIKLYDIQVLEVGEKYSRYSSILADRIDSVYYVVSKRKAVRENKNGSDGGGFNPRIEARLQENENPLYDDIYINYPNAGLLTVTRKFAEIEYIYEEPAQKFEWKFHSDTTTIIGYKCLKATTTFRGRSYEVWFTPFLPIRQGMWKFNGLPGLILKAADTKGYFEWTAIGIEKPQDKNIYTYNFEKANVKTTTRENVIKLLHKRWQDPIGLLFANTSILQAIQIGDKTYKRGEPSDMKYPYIPIPELE